METYAIWFIVTILAFIVGVFVALVFFMKSGIKFLKSRNEGSELKKTLDLYGTALDYLIKQKYQEANQVVTNIVQIDTDNLDLYFIIAEICRNTGEINKALRIHENILVREPDDQSVVRKTLYEMALDYRCVGLIDRSIEMLDQVLSLGDKSHQVLQLLFDILVEQGDWERAYQVLNKIQKITKIDKSSQKAFILVQTGKKFVDMREYKESRKYFSKAIAENKNCTIARFELALLMEKEGKLIKMLHLFKEIFGPIVTINILILNYLVELMEQGILSTQEFVGQIDLYQKKVEETAYIRYYMIVYHIKNQNLDEAKNTLVQLLKDYPIFLDGVPFIKKICLDNQRDSFVKDHLLEIFNWMGDEYFRRFSCCECGFGTKSYYLRCPKCGLLDTFGVSWAMEKV